MSTCNVKHSEKRSEKYSAKISWIRETDTAFIDNQYSRAHEWIFNGGTIVKASSAPNIVPLPYSVASHVDPEEAFVASLSSCHMLFFLSIAANNGWVVDSYLDNAIGVMEKGDNGKLSMTRVTLDPTISFANNIAPSVEQLTQMHHQSHDQCFIANSVKTRVVTKINNHTN